MGLTTEFLIHLLKNPAIISNQDIKELEKILIQYPYFQLAFTLVAKGLYDQKSDLAQQAIQRAALYATNRSQLKKKLYSLSPSSANSTDPVNVVIEKKDDLATLEAVKARRNAKKEEQISIIENFIKKKDRELQRIVIKDVSLSQPFVDLTKTSTTLHDGLLTENLAKVFLAQGRKEQAIAIYKHLQKKFPDKEAYFLSIEEEKKR